jgi:hypothetical protein
MKSQFLMIGLRIWTVQQNSALRACPPVLSMWNCKIFLSSKFSYSRFFCNPTNKTETGNCIYVGTINRKPPGPITIFGQSKTGRTCQIIFITPFSSKCTPLLRLLPALANWAHMQEQNHFSWVKPVCFQFSSFDFTVEGHILSTGGDALRCMKLWPADINSSFQT